MATSQDWVERINGFPDGWLKAMGIEITEATGDSVSCQLELGSHHHQGYGIVHGGVHAGIIESLASIGAAIVAGARGQLVVGLENTTSFIRAARGGRLHATATPVTRGRTTQVWQATVWDAEDRVLATGRVRLLCIDPDRLSGGEAQRPET